MEMIKQTEEEILSLQREVFKLYKVKYKKEIAERLRKYKDPEWIRLRKEQRLKLNYIEIAKGKKFINIRINEKGEVIGRQHFKYGFDIINDPERDLTW